MTTALLQGFPPIVGDGARVLILGSFPSVQSLAMRQYYANPRNAFWAITAALFGFDAAAPYEERLGALRSHHVALATAIQQDSTSPNFDRGGAVSVQVGGQPATAYMAPLDDQTTSSLVDLGSTTIMIRGPLTRQTLPSLVSSLKGR